MKKLKLLMSASVLAIAANSAHATVAWNFSFGAGQETGVFSTNGTYADTAGNFTFTIDPTTFTMTASTYAPSLVGATFTVNQPTTGFIWNGIVATQFWRSSGVYTNSAVFTGPGSYTEVFIINSGPKALYTFNITSTTTPSALTLTPVAASAVPEPASLGLLLLGATGLGLGLRRRKPAA